MPARVPVGRQPLDQPLKRQLLVLDRVEQPAPGPTQQLRERRRAGQVAAQHDRVDEGADQLLELRPAAVVDRDPDDHVLLAAVSVEQHLVGREERHEQRGALRPGGALGTPGYWPKPNEISQLAVLGGDTITHPAPVCNMAPLA